MSIHVVMIAHFKSSSALPTEVLMAESDATIKLHKEKVQQLLSENLTLRSQLTLPAPVKTEAPFSKINILIQCYILFYYKVCSYVKLCRLYFSMLAVQIMHICIYNSDNYKYHNRFSIVLSINGFTVIVFLEYSLN